MTLPEEYRLFRARWKLKQLFRPIVSRTPAASTVRFGIQLHRYGFTVFFPGIPGSRCGRRVMYSWRNWVEGPCSYATWLRLRELDNANRPSIL